MDIVRFGSLAPSASLGVPFFVIRKMDEQLALRLLRRIMQWGEDVATQEYAWVRLLAGLKYDGYGDYVAGVRFAESLAARRTEVFNRVATNGMWPAIGKLAARRAGAEAILAQLAGF